MSWYENVGDTLGTLAGYADDVADLALKVKTVEQTFNPKKAKTPPPTATVSKAQSGMSTTTILLIIAAIAVVYFVFLK